MVLSCDYLQAGELASHEGIYIPATDLPGVDAAELITDPATEGKVTLALLNALATVDPAPLGFSVTAGTTTGAGPSILNQGFTLAWQLVTNLTTGTIAPAPLPIEGANLGAGGLAVTDVFPGAVKVAAAAAAPAAGIVISTDQLAEYGPVVHASLNLASDSRALWAALADTLGAALALRTGETASAIVARTLGSVGSQTIPAAWTAATDPLSGLAAADLPSLGLITRSVSVSIQLELNQTTQTFDVRAVTN